MAITIDALTRYPVKGLSGELLNSVELKTGQGFPCDRQFGFARPNSGFDPDNPKPLPKSRFYMLARDSSLALLNTEYIEETGLLSIASKEKSATFDINTTEGKQSASLFLQDLLCLPNDEVPHLYEASPHRFTDVSVRSVEMMNAVSIVNTDSILAFAKTIGHDVDPKRFRANIQISGFPAFTELEMVGQQLSIGTVKLAIVQRTKRCSATEVDLSTGERNIKTPTLLRQHYGHMDMGIYAEVLQGGVICQGDVVEVMAN